MLFCPLWIFLIIIIIIVIIIIIIIIIILNNLSGIPSVSNSLNPDQARHFVRPDLGPNCLRKKLSAHEKSPQADIEFIWLF